MADLWFNEVASLLILAIILPSLAHGLHSQDHHVPTQGDCWSYWHMPHSK